MIRYRIRHETLYSYSDQVAISHNISHLMPRATPTQSLCSTQLLIEPAPVNVRDHRDYFGNPTRFFIVNEPHDRLRVLAESVVEIRPPSEPVVFTDSPEWEAVAKTLRATPDAETMKAYEYVFDSELVQTSDQLAEYARLSFTAGRPVLDASYDLCRRIYRDFEYDPEATTLATPLTEVVRERHGVCQDFAHVLIGALRSLGLSARYVSGYIRSRAPVEVAKKAGKKKTTPDRGVAKKTDGQGAPPDLVGADASHAWAAVYSPGFGWLDLDPTNDMVPSDRHAVLAWGRDYQDVSPLQGVTLGGGLQTVRVGVSMRPNDELHSEV